MENNKGIKVKNFLQKLYNFRVKVDRQGKPIANVSSIFAAACLIFVLTRPETASVHYDAGSKTMVVYGKGDSTEPFRLRAGELMDRMGIRKQDRRQYVDMLAASVILQEYMENHRQALQELRAGETSADR